MPLPEPQILASVKENNMSIERTNEFGKINIEVEAIATLAGGAVSECYGIVGMASRKFFKDGWAELLKTDNYAKGVEVRKTENGLELDLYILVSYGVKISEVVTEAQKKVAYVMKKALDLSFSTINIYVQGVKVIDWWKST